MHYVDERDVRLPEFSVLGGHHAAAVAVSQRHSHPWVKLMGEAERSSGCALFEKGARQGMSAPSVRSQDQETPAAAANARET